MRTLIQQDAIGEPPKKRQKKVYVQLQTRLKTLCQDVASGRKEVPEFLAGVAHNIRWAPIDRETRDGNELAWWSVQKDLLTVRDK